MCRPSWYGSQSGEGFVSEGVCFHGRRSRVGRCMFSQSGGCLVWVGVCFHSREGSATPQLLSPQSGGQYDAQL